MPRTHVPLVALLLALLPACSADTSERTPAVPATLRPPPRIGESITQSTMCSCRACSKADCCGGAAEPGASEGLGRCDNYDFGAPGCELSVESCSARCYEETWRVRGAETCADKRPAIWCEG